jgi:protein-S-isoprenylcysteine O-methyltransferase Ste14
MQGSERTGLAMDEEFETAGVAAPPPLIFGVALALGLALSRLQPQAEQGARFARALGAASVVAGIALGAATIAALKRAGTNLDPYKPSTALVTGGVFAFSRNPAYVAATSIYVGIAMYAGSLPAFILLPVALALLDRLVVNPEERYLARRFGDEYRRYYEAVPRWF